MAKNASVLVSSQTPNNVWEGGKFNGAPSRFVGYAKTAAGNVKGASFVDHFQATANAYLKAGSVKVNAMYPKDHTHTSPEGADLVAQAFVEAVRRDFNGTTPLKAYLTAGNPVPF